MPTFDTLAGFWTTPMIMANVLVFFNLLGALLLGLLVGYERSYHGRAAGMRTYGLVCMASAALTVIGGYSSAWFGGDHQAAMTGDTTRVIQGIVTGIGFLCAGVIMREGFNISGLTTAASLWAASVIGILVGVGFYAAAIALAALSAFSMMWISRLETWLPSRQAVAITLRFRPGFLPSEPALRQMAETRGYDIASGTIAIELDDGVLQWSFVAVARNRQRMMPISELSHEMTRFDGVTGFQLNYARN
ncbi:MgtC/SapB family protein [Curvibacter sp. PAE-UM]|uniref:MgtC/SapB family protein n=1 Tax=Curvibacter sp. PAE-UM TaxID=1714344 RepID=UPI00070C0871|nr:MgtC/SapB family protein [Curvibacter sp. PAE-UM]KRI00641.1 magnesium transporter MgtC [Curvibacter sp. PAE-UM]